MALSAISMNSALADKDFVLSLHHKLHVSTCINKPNDVHKHNQSIFDSINQSFLHKQPPSVMKLSPGIYSKKESYKTESHKANLTVQVEAFNCSYTHVRNL